MAVVISKKSTDSHIIDKYKFKVLSFGGHEKNEQEYTSENSTNVEKEQENSLEDVHSHEISSSSKDELVESLLKKTDEMSSNFIKLQMRLEEKEEEFKIELEKVKEEAYNQGLKDAKEKLLNEQENQLENTIEQFTKSINTLDESATEFKNSLNKIENELVNAAIDIAKEVILVELDKNSSDIAVRLSSELIEDLKESAKITLKVNPKDHTKVSEKIGKLENIDIISDSAISPGGVIAISDSGNIDSEIMKRYERVKRAALGG